MADAIRLSVSGDTQALVDAVKKGAVAVEDLQDVLKDAGKQGDRSGDDITDAMSKGQKDTKELKSEIKRATDEFEKAGRAGRDFGDNVYSGSDKAREGIDGMGEEAQSTGREMAASFQGPEDALSAIQELAANALSGLGPAGVVAGAAAAIGIGVVTAELQKQQEQADAVKAKMTGMYQAAIEEGRDYISEAQILAEAQDLIWNRDRVDEYAQVQKNAVALGLDVNTVIRARAGDEEANNTVVSRGKALLDEIGAQLSDNDKTNDAAATKRFSEVQRSIELNRDLATQFDTNKKLVADTNQLLATSTEKQRDTNAATRDQGAAVDEVARKIGSLPKSVAVPVLVDFTGAEAAISAFTRRERAAIQIGASVVGPTGKRVIA